MFFKPVKPKSPFSRKKLVNVYKTKSQILQEFLKNHNGPLTLKNSKLINAKVKLHQKRKEEENKRCKLIMIDQPTRTVFKKKSPPKAKPKSPPKAKCMTPRCKALKMKNQKICDAKIKNGGEFCKRHRKK